MSLVFSLKEGQDFYVGEERFEMVKIVDDHEFIIEARSDPNGKPPKRWVITDAHSREIMPDVFVSAGGMHQPDAASVAIDAPRELVILRGVLRRAERRAQRDRRT